MSKGDSFFGELDSKKEKKTITVREVMIFIVVVLIVIEALIFFTAKSFRSAKFDFKDESTKINPSSLTTSNVEVNTVSEIVLSEKSLCEQIYKIYNSKDISCSIKKDGLYVFGRTSGLMLANANLKLNPVIKDQRLKLELAELRFGRFDAPEFIKSSASKGVIAKLENILNPAGFAPRAIDLSDDLMIVSGTVK